MERVKIDLTNCYGIRSLSREFNFTRTQAFALYAPNGVMKSSLARTFQDAAEERDSEDRIFPNRNTVRQITDENDKEINGNRILVVFPYDEDLGVNEQTSTLLLNPSLKKEYDELLRATAEAKATLIEKIKAQSQSRMDMESEISSAIMPSENEFEAALIRVRREVEEQKEVIFPNVQYDKIFNEKVLKALNTKDLKTAIHEYARRYNELLAASTYFKKGTFDYYNAAQIAKSLADNGFFDANHSVSLNADSGNREITDKEQLEEVISEEKDAILADAALRSRFDDIARQLMRNAELRDFYSYVLDDEAILSRLNNPEGLRQEVLKDYLKVNEEFYADWMAKYDAAQKRRKELEEEAWAQRTQWEAVIDIFNERFFVPFKLEAKNKTDVMLGRTAIIDLGFTYVDGQDSAELNRNELIRSLSTGERKALYVLNVIFEIETRIAARRETLIVVDDLADSFDYRNKYAIIQYLRDISAEGIFKLLIMTHNFDFLRTIESRFVGYPNCLMASKNGDGISITQAAGIRNVFARDWKKHFFRDARKKIASIPFLRNLVEMTTGEDDPRYGQLTTMLHWKAGSEGVTIGNLDAVYNSICQEDGQSTEPRKLVLDLIKEEAEGCLEVGGGVRLENKIVLAIAIRLLSEKFMIEKIADPEFVEALTSNQARGLLEKFKAAFPDKLESNTILDRVGLMTPENIHLNSFMYEPLIDMSDDHLRKLYVDFRNLE